MGKNNGLANKLKAWPLIKTFSYKQVLIFVYNTQFWVNILDKFNFDIFNPL